MKIAICNSLDTNNSQKGGGVNVSLQLAAKLNKNNEVTFFTRENPTKTIIDFLHANEIKLEPIKLVNNNITPFFSWYNIPKIIKGDFDIINSHRGSFAAYSSILNIGKKRFLNVHEWHIIDKNDVFKNKIHMMLENELFKMASKNSHIIVNSSYTKQLLKNNDINNTTVIPNGIDTSIYKPYCKNNLEIKNQDKTLLYVGRLIPRKGIITLINSFEHILKHNNNIRLIIIGQGFLYNEIKKKLLQNNLNKKIKLLGKISIDQLIKWYSIADLTVVPSYFEPFGLVPLESLACGTPVITSKCGGFTETLSEKMSFASFFSSFNPSTMAQEIVESLERVNLNDNKLARQYIKNQFDWEIIAQKYETMFKSSID